MIPMIRVIQAKVRMLRDVGNPRYSELVGLIDIGIRKSRRLGLRCRDFLYVVLIIASSVLKFSAEPAYFVNAVCCRTR